MPLPSYPPKVGDVLCLTHRDGTKLYARVLDVATNKVVVDAYGCPWELVWMSKAPYGMCARHMEARWRNRYPRYHIEFANRPAARGSK